MSTLPSLKVIFSITTSSHRLLTSLVVMIERIDELRSKVSSTRGEGDSDVRFTPRGEVGREAKAPTSTQPQCHPHPRREVR